VPSATSLPQVRYERVQQELLRLKAAAGQEAHLPDFDAEEVRRHHSWQLYLCVPAGWRAAELSPPLRAS